MKYLTGLLPLFLTGNLFATNLCDSACNLTITFPDGGSIKAKEEIILTFGEGGYINNGSSTVAYSVGEQLELAEKDSITFKDSGVFDLGRGGNISYSEMKITTDGVAELSAIGGKKLVSIEEVSFNDDVTVNISSDFEVIYDGSLKIKDGFVNVNPGVSFTNYGYVKGYFEFEEAVLTYIDEDKAGDDNQDKSVLETILEKLNGAEQEEPEEDVSESEEISGKVYFKTNRWFRVVSSSPEIESGVVEEQQEIDDNGIQQDDSQVDGSIQDGSIQLEEPVTVSQAAVTDSTVSVASAGGLLNQLFVILFIAPLLVCRYVIFRNSVG